MLENICQSVRAKACNKGLAEIFYYINMQVIRSGRNLFNRYSNWRENEDFINFNEINVLILVGICKYFGSYYGSVGELIRESGEGREMMEAQSRG